MFTISSKSIWVGGTRISGELKRLMKIFYKRYGRNSVVYACFFKHNLCTFVLVPMCFVRKDPCGIQVTNYVDPATRILPRFNVDK